MEAYYTENKYIQFNKRKRKKEATKMNRRKETHI